MDDLKVSTYYTDLTDLKKNNLRTSAPSADEKKVSTDYKYVGESST